MWGRENLPHYTARDLSSNFCLAHLSKQTDNPRPLLALPDKKKLGEPRIAHPGKRIMHRLAICGAKMVGTRIAEQRCGGTRLPGQDKDSANFGPVPITVAQLQEQRDYGRMNEALEESFPANGLASFCRFA